MSLTEDFKTVKYNPLYKSPEDTMTDEEYVNWLKANDPRCPLYTIDAERELISSGKFDAELMELYKLLEFENENGFLMSKKDKLRLKLLKAIAIKRSSTRKTLDDCEKKLQSAKDKKKKPEVDPVELLHSKIKGLKFKN